MRKVIEIDGVAVIGYAPWGCIDLISAGSGEMKSGMDLSNAPLQLLAESRKTKEFALFAGFEMDDGAGWVLS